MSSGVAAALNAFNGTNDATTNAELTQSRQLLVEALASTVINSERLDADAVDVVAGTLEVITRNPAQLSTKSIEQTLELLVIATESSTDVPRLVDTQTAMMIMTRSIQMYLNYVPLILMTIVMASLIMMLQLGMLTSCMLEPQMETKRVSI